MYVKVVQKEFRDESGETRSYMAIEDEHGGVSSVKKALVLPAGMVLEVSTPRLGGRVELIRVVEDAS